MLTKKIENIIIKYFSRSASIIELESLSKWLEKSENMTVYREFVKTNYLIEYNLMDFDSETEKQKILQRIQEKKILFGKRRVPSILKYAAAIAILTTATYFYTTEKRLFSKQPIVVDNSIEIGTDKATLTLDDGSMVALEKGKTFTNATANSDGEKIVYVNNNIDEINKKPEIAFNYLTIPRGGEFYLELSDNTKVWLNSDSKIKYPVQFFDGQTREVEIIYGEAYFDVSPSSEHRDSKFMVKTQDQFIEVLGTEFNVKAYKEDKIITTTLVEGKISVKSNNETQLMYPSEQMKYNISDRSVEVNDVDVSKAIAWRNRVFNFDNETITEISLVLSRWYDVEFVIKNKELYDLKFNGILGKDQNIEIILLTLKNTKKISYEIIDNKIIIN